MCEPFLLLLHNVKGNAYFIMQINSFIYYVWLEELLVITFMFKMFLKWVQNLAQLLYNIWPDFFCKIVYKI